MRLLKCSLVIVGGGVLLWLSLIAIFVQPGMTQQQMNECESLAAVITIAVALIVIGAWAL